MNVSEERAQKHLYDLGIFQMCPGLWCDKREPTESRKSPGLMTVAPEQDNALGVYGALLRIDDIPPVGPEEGA